MARFLYDLVLLLLLPFAALAVSVRARRQTGGTGGLAVRFGRVARRTDRPLWLHAASVGEVQAAVPLVRALRALAPDLPLVVTTFTAAGGARAATAFGADVQVLPLPWDLRPCVGAFLGRIRPRGLLIMEAELWPNLLHGCVARDIPFAFVSARLSERSLARVARVGSLLRGPLAHTRAVLAQTAADGARWQTLGVPAGHVRVAGNIKWDVDVPPALETEAAELRTALAPGRSWLVAGSTREGEEELLCGAFTALRATLPDLLLVLVPRHPERADAVARVCERHGLSVVRRTADVPLADAAVLLVDRLGELMTFYAAADLVFVGGSLLPHGGHNLLEPAALGRAVLTGPHHTTAPEVLAVLRARDAVRVVTDAGAMAAVAGPLLGDANQRRALGARAREVVVENRGALSAALACARDLAGS